MAVPRMLARLRWARDARLRTAAAAELHGAFAFPIRNGTEFLGVLEFFSRRIREPDEKLLEMIELENVPLDGRVLVFALLASVATGLLFGLVPTALSRRLDLARALRETGGRTSWHSLAAAAP